MVAILKILQNIANDSLLQIQTYILLQWFYINIHTYMPEHIHIHSYLAQMGNGETECSHKQFYVW